MKTVGKIIGYMVLAALLVGLPNYLIIRKAKEVADEAAKVRVVIEHVVEMDKTINERLKEIESILQIKPKEVLKDKVNEIKDKGKVRVPKKIGDYLNGN